MDLLDTCRSEIHDALNDEFDNLAFDVIFTRDPRWIGVSVGTAVVSSKATSEGGSDQ
jgi:hypothetical protein